MKMLFTRPLLFDEGSALSTPAAGGEAPPVDDLSGAVETPTSIYGDLEVKFPEGLDAEVQNSTFLQPFVDKESGDINYANMMKSYVHAQKNMNKSKVTLPGEDATDTELDEFYSKLGYKVDESEYVLEKGEESVMSDEQLQGLKKFARENRMPLEQAKKLVNYVEGSMKTSMDSSAQATAAQIKEGLDNLQTEWGQAYESKLGVAKKVLEDFSDEGIMEQFKDPRVGSNPGVIKFLNKLGEKLYKEDGFKGDSDGSGALSPAEAQEEINNIMSDKSGPYWNKSDARHADTVKKVNRLYQMKTGR